METTIWTLVSLLVGGIITFLVSRHYYMAASEELTNEAEKLRAQGERLHRTTQVIAISLEVAGLAKLTRDVEGTVTSVIERRHVHDVGMIRAVETIDNKTIPE